MSNDNTFRATHYLPQVAVATAFVAVLPVVVVWLLLAEGVISSPWVCVGLAIALSFAASFLGSAYWKRRSGPGEVLFSEILLWGWLRRFHNERTLARAMGLLGLNGSESDLSGSVGQKAELLRQMAARLDAQDPYTDGHSRRVALHAAMIARKMGMSGEQAAAVQMAAAVHDVGKLRVPLEVLNKPSELAPAELALIRQHADQGAEIVSALEDPELTAMVRHHHERFDGTGYPAGLVGEQSPLGARIIAVADTFDALTSQRPYRPAVPHKRAMEIIVSASGTQLDPAAVRAFLKCYSGKRAVFFWTLLTVSPQRALAYLGGRRGVRMNFGPAATVAMPAALAAIVATAYGTVGTVSRPLTPARFAQRSLVASASTNGQKSSGSSHRGSARDLARRSGGSPTAKQATLGTTVSHTPGGAVSGHRRASSTGGTTGSPGNSRPGSGGSGTGKRSGGGGSGRGSSHHGTRGTPPTGPLGYGGKPGSGGKGSGGGAGSGSSSPSSPPASGGSPGAGASGSSSGSTGNGAGNGQGNGGGNGQGNGGGNGQGNGGGNGQGNGGGNGQGNGGGNGQGNGGGNGQGGGGNGQGGSGSGTGPGNPPLKKQDCMDGGWIHLQFRNQGLCIAFVEHQLHGSISIGVTPGQAGAPAVTLRLALGL